MGVHMPPICLFVLAAIVNLISLAQSQPAANCNIILLFYSLNNRTVIRPNVSNPADQPYGFKATATVLNSGTSPLIAWALLISFAYREVIVSADTAALTDATTSFPFNTSTSADPTSLSGTSLPDLKTPIATAGDLTQIQAVIPIVGTLFARPPPFIPLPSALSLDDPSLLCPPVAVGSSNTSISTCCVPNPKFRANTTDDPLAGANATISARRPGDFVISYDVIQAFPSSYLALVTLTNNHPLGRLDNWHLSFDWTRGEFIYEIKGAYTSVKGPSGCITGPQGQYYQQLDFTNVANCQRRPTILDLPATMANDSATGRIPNCCRNGTILPAEMDPTETESAFQIQVFKMPPDLNRTTIFPPSNWRITGGELNPDFRCGPPSRVSPTQFPDPSGLQSHSLAIASWEIVCNINKRKGSTPKCCVSFSAYYNDSVVPCKTCACGCPSSPSRTCSTTAPALLLPPQALLVPFENRTSLSLAWAKQKHYNVPNPMPCGDSCGVSINWHINSDFRQGWTSRVTLFNWEDVSFADWFVAAEMDSAAYAGFEAMYSFNGSAMGNNTLFMQGLPGLNYLVGEVDGQNPGDPRVPGKQQSVVSFTKKNKPTINVVEGDGFPTKVFFNGEECSLPDIIPVSGVFRVGSSGALTLILLLISILLQ